MNPAQLSSKQISSLSDTTCYVAGGHWRLHAGSSLLSTSPTILLALSSSPNSFYPWADGGRAAGCPSAGVALPGAAVAGQVGRQAWAAASSLVHGMAFSPLAAYAGISSELSIFFQEHFRRKAPLCFAIDFSLPAS